MKLRDIIEAAAWCSCGGSQVTGPCDGYQRNGWCESQPMPFDPEHVALMEAVHEASCAVSEKLWTMNTVPEIPIFSRRKRLGDAIEALAAYRKEHGYE